MKSVEPKTIKLSDYKAPAFDVLNAHLTFDLELNKTKVTAKVEYKLKEGAKIEPLTLDGVDLELESIKIDESSLSENEYERGEETLTILTPPEEFTLTITNFINPEANKALEGLYRSGDMYCTQCEAEGFRRITFFMDRPDVMTTYQTKIIADKSKNPVLLSNGNLIESGDLENGRHFAKWEDPFKKPTYLFALVAGDLGLVQDTYKTSSGRDVDLRVYCDKGNEEKCDYTIESLKESMKWDEQRFGLEYDLDIYMIVAVDSFNMGAMENKGLNIFNSKYVLASPDTATDATYASIQGIVGHEYFHNWTGNRVTCRDWFQLTLKEGLTVFRDQEFSSDLNSRPAERVKNMLGMKAGQFIEDAGPNSHPIKPKAYMDINNFYTATVYSKGSEVIRMYHTLLGEKGFRRGMDKYFELFDGMAVTTEDFLHAMSVANDDYDFSHFSKWYDQSGTPLLKITSDYNEASKELYLTIKQVNKPSKIQPEKQPLFMPFKIGLIKDDGSEFVLNCKTPMSQLSEGIIHISQEEETFVFEGIDSKPFISLNRDFSAPVNMDYDYTEEELAFLMANDSDLVARYSATQLLFDRAVLNKISASKKGETYTPSDVFFSAFKTALADMESDSEIKAMSLCLPMATVIAQKFEEIDYVAICGAIKSLKDDIALKCREALLEAYSQLDLGKAYKIDAHDAGERSLANLIASYISGLSDDTTEIIYQQYKTANNMSTKLGAFKALLHSGSKYEQTVSDDFYNLNKGFDASLQEWMKAISSDPREGALDRLMKVFEIPEFDITIPNHVYATIRMFGSNFANFHAKDGSGYEFMANKVIEIDKINSQVAAGLATSFKQYSFLSEGQKSLMAAQLTRVKEAQGLTKGTFEIIDKTLNS